MKPCPSCHSPNPEAARFCMNCGCALAIEPDGLEAKPRFDILALSLGATLLLTLVLVGVFHWPVFILGGFLPFLWARRRRF